MRGRFFVVGPAVLAAVLSATGEARATVDPEVWVVDNSLVSSGDGSVDHPVSTLAEAEVLSGPGDWIFVRAGDGTTRGLDTGIRLKPDQTLLGEGVGIDTAGLKVAPGARPTITNPDGPGVVLASGCEVAGIDIASTRAAGIAGDEVGDCLLRDLTISSAGGSGVELRNIRGRITIQGVVIDGVGGDGLDLVGSVGAPSASVELNECRMTAIGDDGVDARFTGPATTTLTIDGCEFAEIAGAAVALKVAESSRIGFRMEQSRVAGAGLGIDLTVFDSGGLDYNIVDNPEFSGIESTIINLFVDPDSTAEARVSGLIERNPRMSKKPGSGFGIRVSCNGSAAVAAVVRGNRITGGVDADYGILAEARLGSAVLDLVLTDNDVVVGTEALDAVAIRARDDATVCARIADNRAAGGRTALALRQRGDAVFAIPLLATDKAGPDVVRNRVKTANPGLREVVATADGGFRGAQDACGIPEGGTQ